MIRNRVVNLQEALVISKGGFSALITIPRPNRKMCSFAAVVV